MDDAGGGGGGGGGGVLNHHLTLSTRSFVTLDLNPSNRRRSGPTLKSVVSCATWASSTLSPLTRS